MCVRLDVEGVSECTGRECWEVRARWGLQGRVGRGDERLWWWWMRATLTSRT